MHHPSSDIMVPVQGSFEYAIPHRHLKFIVLKHMNSSLGYPVHYKGTKKSDIHFVLIERLDATPATGFELEGSSKKPKQHIGSLRAAVNRCAEKGNLYLEVWALEFTLKLRGNRTHISYNGVHFRT